MSQNKASTNSQALVMPSGRKVSRLPDMPEKTPDDMTSFNHLSINGNSHYLRRHLGNLDTTIVSGEHLLRAREDSPASEWVYPDLFVAFDVKPQLFVARNGYVISEQGKPPDFVLEIASEATRDRDTGSKKDQYALLGVGEYWRFDETGQFYGHRLAGERLVDGQYQPLPMEETGPGVVRGCSPALNLYIQWEQGELHWYDGMTGQRLLTIEDETARANDETARAERERRRADEERQARLAAEGELRELRERFGLSH